ncbi:hypothetical protein [Saccharothrix sp. HUAS TT1]|uniref:hypothetical protein n=1 Tax=unclassified Saccharothrix TaxID=2593673 RepID=UPI00345BB828
MSGGRFGGAPHDPTAATLAHRFLGTADADLGRHDEAIGHLRQATALFRDLDNTHPHAARAAWESALEVYRAQDGDDDVERVRRRLAGLGG